jgi:hypothetical protein
MVPTPALALDHGFDPNNPVTQWFEALERPLCPAEIKKCFCCGYDDAYAIVIDQEATPDGADFDGRARVTDGSAITFPDGKQRVFIADDTAFTFAGNQVTKLRQGNPTKTAWAFLSATRMGTIGAVWCVVPLPPTG